MKKLMILAALMLAAVAPMAAQEWIFKTLPPDELKGTERDSVALYDDEQYTLMVSFTKNNIRLRAKNCIFDYHKAEYYVLIGIYDAEDTLISRQRIFCWYNNTFSHSIIEINNSRHMFNKNHPGDTIVTRVIEHLTNGDGYVRFIAPMFHCADLDFKIPCFNAISQQ